MKEIIQEFHVCNEYNGHEASVDCWCEPTDIKSKKVNGMIYKVIIHVDANPTNIMHSEIIRRRNLTTDYVTKLLNSIKG